MPLTASQTTEALTTRATSLVWTPVFFGGGTERCLEPNPNRRRLEVRNNAGLPAFVGLDDGAGGIATVSLQAPSGGVGPQGIALVLHDYKGALWIRNGFTSISILEEENTEPS